MSILITGATGLIGKKLVIKLIESGYEDIRVLTRNPDKARKTLPFPISFYHWDIKNKTIQEDALKDIQTIFHLAGENIAASKWNNSQKESIIQSRTQSMNLLLDNIQESNRSIRFVTASAVGYYGDRKEEVLDENSLEGNGFLSEVCQAWENSLLNSKRLNIEKHIVRIGIVLSTEGGALTKMLPAFSMGVAGKLGHGQQYMSWIHIDDLINIFCSFLTGQRSKQVYNAVAPSPITNLSFTKALGKALKRPTFFSVPAPVLKLIMGEMTDLLLQSQRVLPKNLLSENYEYNYPTLQHALEKLLAHKKKGEKTLLTYQWVPTTKNNVFSFFSNEHNLEKITPPSLSFKILNKNTDKIKAGTIINYKLKLYGIPFYWKTHISKFEENIEFIDEQKKGPYKKWVHTHTFINYGTGTLIKDYVEYKIPLGLIGNLLMGWFIKKDLKKIFTYRHQIIGEHFEKKSIKHNDL